MPNTDRRAISRDAAYILLMQRVVHHPHMASPKRALPRERVITLLGGIESLKNWIIELCTARQGDSDKVH